MKVFVSKDAERLAELSAKQTLTARDQADLFGIAERLERLDERLRNLSSATPHTPGRTYADGVRDERLRILGRSNLPTQSVELVGADAETIQRAMAAGRVKKVARGVSGLTEAPAPRKPQVPKYPSLEGIKIDLSRLKV
jgi:hypothetical protein